MGRKEVKQAEAAGDRLHSEDGNQALLETKAPVTLTEHASSDLAAAVTAER